VRGVPNGVESHPRVQLWLADGDREDMRAGRFARFDADNWPVPRTRWRGLRLDPSGGLVLNEPATAASRSYPSLPSIPTMTDVPTAALAGAGGFDALSNAFPMLTEMNVAGLLGLTFTTAPLTENVLMAGPASLELPLSSTAPETGIWAVASDVAPNGSAHPLTVGRLSTAYPEVDERRSLRRRGEIVQPYSDFSAKSPANPGQERLYKVELWPIGNRFAAGHRLRLDLVGASALSMPSLPAVNTIRVGAGTGARLLVPVLPGSRLGRALSAG
jgi:predicted acyl esterase